MEERHCRRIIVEDLPEDEEMTVAMTVSMAEAKCVDDDF